MDHLGQKVITQVAVSVEVDETEITPTPAPHLFYAILLVSESLRRILWENDEKFDQELLLHVLDMRRALLVSLSIDHDSYKLID